MIIQNSELIIKLQFVLNYDIIIYQFIFNIINKIIIQN